MWLSLIAIVLSIIGVFSNEFIGDLPLYCSAVNDEQDRAKFIKNRSIPSLNTKIGDVELKQVQVIIRHGSRTIFGPFQCWPGYVSKFDCREHGELVTPFNGDFGFPKQYDAAPDAQLPGSCQYGQLVAEGYEQHKLTGQILAQRYFKGPAPLFDLESALTNNAELDDIILFRSSDYERTRMSGSTLLSSLLKSVNPDSNDHPITLHTVDWKADTLFPNEDYCLDLREVKNRAMTSSEYLERYGVVHQKARELADAMFNLTQSQPHAWPNQVMDCLYTSICGGHTLPDNSNKEDVETILKATAEEWIWHWRYNNSEYSKLALARLALEIKAFVTKIFPEDVLTDTAESETVYKNSPMVKPVPFVLWSAHDSTVAPFITTFGEKMWENATGNMFPPYASMLVIEVYKTSDVPMIRMIYNSKVVTPSVTGCPSDDDLCPVQTVFEAMSWATLELAFNGCHLKHPVQMQYKFAVHPDHLKDKNLRRHQN